MAKYARNNFLSELDDEVKDGLEKSSSNNRLPLVSLPITNESLMKNRALGLHAVEAKTILDSFKKRNIKIRIITNTGRGANVLIPCDSNAMYQKYLDLRFQIRNRDYVEVLFDEMYVVGSKIHFEIFLKAFDFKIVDLNH